MARFTGDRPAYIADLRSRWTEARRGCAHQLGSDPAGNELSPRQQWARRNGHHAVGVVCRYPSNGSRTIASRLHLEQRSCRRTRHNA